MKIRGSKKRKREPREGIHTYSFIKKAVVSKDCKAQVTVGQINTVLNYEDVKRACEEFGIHKPPNIVRKEGEDEDAFDERKRLARPAWWAFCFKIHRREINIRSLGGDEKSLKEARKNRKKREIEMTEKSKAEIKISFARKGVSIETMMAEIRDKLYPDLEKDWGKGESCPRIIEINRGDYKEKIEEDKSNEISFIVRVPKTYTDESKFADALAKIGEFLIKSPLIIDLTDSAKKPEIVKMGEKA